MTIDANNFKLLCFVTECTKNELFFASLFQTKLHQRVGHHHVKKAKKNMELESI